MPKVIMLRGLPGSGKTTWAEAWKAENPAQRVVITKDDIGMEIAQVNTKCETPRNKDFRKKIKARQESLIKQALKQGKDVCIADTNLPGEVEKTYRVWCDESGIDYTFEVNDSFLDVPLMEVLDRNNKRGCDMVPESVIFEMYNTFIRGRHFLTQNVNNPACVVFDMDGTLAEKGDRGIYEWDKVGVDTPNLPIVELARMFADNGYKIVIVSARQATEACVMATWQWLEANHIPFDDILMRKDGDSRRDWIVKQELLDEVLKSYYVHLWVDDRFQVVTHIRSLGINVLQCKDGRY